MKNYQVVFYSSGNGCLRTSPLPEAEVLKIKEWLLEDTNKPYYIKYGKKHFKTEFAVFFKNNLVCVDFDLAEVEE
jgi:hypothetical protein